MNHTPISFHDFIFTTFCGISHAVVPQISNVEKTPRLLRLWSAFPMNLTCLGLVFGFYSNTKFGFVISSGFRVLERWDFIDKFVVYTLDPDM